MEDLQYDLCPSCKLNVPYRAKKCPHCHEWMPAPSKLGTKIGIIGAIIWTIILVSTIIYIAMIEDKPMPTAGYIIVPASSLGMYFTFKTIVDRFINWIS